MPGSGGQAAAASGERPANSDACLAVRHPAGPAKNEVYIATFHPTRGLVAHCEMAPIYSYIPRWSQNNSTTRFTAPTCCDRAAIGQAAAQPNSEMTSRVLIGPPSEDAHCGTATRLSAGWSTLIND